MAKEMLEFFDPTAERPWSQPEGYPEGVRQVIVTQCPETGASTRMTEWAPGVRDTRVLTHDFWEEVYIIEGDLTVNGTPYTAGMVAVRPPGMPHGPFSSTSGCKTFEVYYYSK